MHSSLTDESVRRLQAGAGVRDGFLPPPWHTAEATGPRTKWIEASFDQAARQRVAEWLTPAGEPAGRRLDAFVADRGVMVTTGQQAGLFGGPMLTVAKALTAVHLADQLQERLERPVLPVFWIASDDHDYEEIRTTWFSDRDGIGSLSLPEHPAAEGRPIGSMAVPECMDELLGQVAQGLCKERFGDTVVKWIGEAYSPRTPLPRAFSALLSQILSHLPICFLDASSRTVHAASSAAYLRDLEGGERIARELVRTASALTAVGVTPQVPILDQATNLFLDRDGARERLYRRNDAFVTGDSGHAVTSGELREIATRAPEHLSPGVLLRPVVEATILPTVAQVAGPSEIRYLAQIGPLFDHHGVERPVVVARRSVTILEGWMSREMERLGVKEADVAAPFDMVWERFVRKGRAESAAPLGSELREAIVDAYAEFVDRATEMPADARQRVLALRNRSLSLAHDAERAVVRAIKRRSGEDRIRLERLHGMLRPFGAPQDRTLSILPFLARHGPDLVDRIGEAIARDLKKASSREARGAGIA